jgi:hypothetical protein
MPGNSDQTKIPLAGLDPATHVLQQAAIWFGKDVDGRIKPGQGVVKLIEYVNAAVLDEFPVGGVTHLLYCEGP